MKRKLFTLVLIFIFLYSFSNSYSQNSEHKRWSVKTLTDIDTSHINFKKIVNTSVHEQVNLKRPDQVFNKRNTSETTVYSMDCYIVGFKDQKDTDIHVILKDTKTSETMVAEIISPKDDNVKKTSRHKQLKKLRKYFVKNIGKPKQSFTMFKDPKLVTITGMGFWDSEHGQKGMAANGREIHPVLSIKLKQ